MPETADLPQQKCPACGTLVNVADIEPLARVECPQCGEKFRVERVFDHFGLVETLGVGGMGSVYKARDTRLERFVALKLLRKELSADPAEAARLEQEARFTAAVNHPNVVQVYSAGTADGQIYLVMELVDHGSLDDLMAQKTRVGEVEALRAGIQVARGLQAAHDKGLIHRDVKPANILFADEQTAKIGDFGLAGAAEQSAEGRKEIWGTPYYVAPERLNNEPEDLRSDIYSLGATLFHAIAGKPPMEGETTSASELRELKSHPPDLRTVAPDVKSETARVINRMIAPNPEERFGSYGELIDQLVVAYNAAAGIGKKSRLLIGIAALLIVLVGGGAYLFHQRSLAKARAAAGAGLTLQQAALQTHFNDARRLILEGKYDQASTAFTKLAIEAGTQQPEANWARLHVGLTARLQGKPGPARDAFQQVEKTAAFSNDKSKAPLVAFFTDTSRALSAAGPVRANAFPDVDLKTVSAFAPFLFGIKNWELREFGDATAWLDKFAASAPPNEFSWMNDYKPLAKKMLEDGKLYAEWKQSSEHLTSVGEMRDGVSKVKALQGKLQLRTTLNDYLKDEEKRLTTSATQKEQAEKQSKEQEQKQLLERETPAWSAALAEAQGKIARYDFAGALASIDSVTVSEPTLKEAQTAEHKKAAWLVEWKNKLIADLKTGTFKGTVQVGPTAYQGAVGATESEITLRVGQYGAAPFGWGKFPPNALLAMANAFVRPNAPDTADRQWLSAVFAYATGQAEAGKQLAEAAAKLKPELRDQIKILPPAAR
ncbi:MAG: serine/threonine-protein kinase [Chthoniobacterales bacterium]